MRDEFWIKYKGRVHGPFTVSQLRSGLKRGKLSRSHGVSANRRTWQPLGDMLAELDAAGPQAPTFGTPMGGGGHPPSGTDSDVPMAPPSSGHVVSPAFGQPGQGVQIQPQPAEGTLPCQDPETVWRAHSRSIKVELLIGGIAIVLSMILPILFLENGRYIWTLAHILPEMSPAAQFSTVLWLLTGVGMIVLTFSTRRLARSIPIVSAMAVSWLLFSTVAVDHPALTMPNQSASIFLIVATVTSLIMVIATAKWRAVGPTVTRRTLTCISGSFLSIACLIGLILLAVALIEDAFTPAFRPEPGVLGVVLLVMLMTALGLGLTAGIFGILQVSPNASPGLNKVCGVFARVSLAIIFGCFGALIGAMMYYIAEHTDTHSAIPVGTALLQFGFIPLAYCGAFAYAIYELMLSCSIFAANRAAARPMPAGGPMGNAPQAPYAAPPPAAPPYGQPPSNPFG